jgi:hypothetical protein
MWEYMWGEYVSQLIRQLIRVYSYLGRIERSSSGKFTGQSALGRKERGAHGCCLGESAVAILFRSVESGEYVFHFSKRIC